MGESPSRTTPDHVLVPRSKDDVLRRKEGSRNPARLLLAHPLECRQVYQQGQELLRIQKVKPGPLMLTLDQRAFHFSHRFAVTQK